MLRRSPRDDGHRVPPFQEQSRDVPRRSRSDAVVRESYRCIERVPIEHIEDNRRSERCSFVPVDKGMIRNEESHRYTAFWWIVYGPVEVSLRDGLQRGCNRVL